MLRMARTAHRETGTGESLPRRRRGAQLRRQRPDPPRGAVQAALDPAGGRRRRRRAGRGAAHLAPASASSRAPSTPGKDAMKGAYLGPAFSDDEIEAFLKSIGASVRAARARRAAHRARGAAAGRREDRRLVRRPDGVRPAGARAPQHPRRPAQPADAGRHEHQDQVPRGVPAVRAERAARAGAATTSSWTATRPTCCSWRRCKQERQIPHDRGAAGAVGHRPAERAPLRHPGGHPHRLLGARPDRRSRRPTRTTTT